MNTLLAWLFTYLIHSTVLLSIAWVLDRALRGRPEWQEPIWKVALAGGLLTATVQAAAPIRPWGGTWAIGVEAPAAAVEIAETPSVLLEVIASGREDALGEAEQRPVLRVVAAPKERVEVAASAAAAAPGRWTWRHVALGAWAVEAALLLVALGLSWRSLGRRLAGRRSLAGEPLQALLSALASREPRVGEPRLSATPRVAAPIALGILRPEICVPERVAEELPRDAQESLLAHELGHLARRDPLWRLLSLVIGRVLFFQPLNWIAAQRLSACAELLADDWAARRTARPLSLAECLTTVARWTAGPVRGLPIAAMAAEPSELKRRVERLVRGEGLTGAAERPAWAGPVAGFALTALALLAPSACGVAEASGKPPAAPAQAAPNRAAAAPRPEPRGAIAADADRDDDDDDDPPYDRGSAGERKKGRRGEERARHADKGRHAKAHRHDHDDDDDDDDDERAGAGARGDSARGPGRFRVEVPPLDLHLDLDDEDIDAQVDRIRESVRRSMPSPEALEAQINQALAQVKKHGPDDKELQKQIEKEMQRAKKEARRSLAEAHKEIEESLGNLDEMKEGLRQAREQLRELEARRPEIERQIRAAQKDAMKRAKDKEKAKRERERAAAGKAQKGRARGRDDRDDDEPYGDD